MRRHEATAGLDRELLLIASVVVVGAIMSILDTTIVNVALARLGEDLSAPLDDVQWVATGYLLALAIVIPLSGWTAERFGTRRVWLTSVALFVAGSVLCGAAWSLESLVTFRVLQGLGGGMVMPVGMIVLAQSAGPQRVGRVMSVIGVPMLLAPVLGPVLGGLIVDDLSWRWIFFVNVPVGLVGIALGLRFLPRAPTSHDAGRLDVLGMVLLSPGLALLVFGLSETSTHGGLGATTAWLPLVAGVPLLAAFTLHALRARRPLIDMRLFGERPFASAAATSFLVAMALFGSLIVLPLLFQVARGESPLHAGLLLAPQGLGAALAMPLSGTLTDRIGGGRVALAGIVAMTVATIPLALIGPGTPLWAIDAVLFVRGIALGFSMMPAMAAAYAALEPAEVPRATSALNVIQRVGGSIGTTILAVVLAGKLGTMEPNAAFAHTFWWTVGITVVAVLPAAVLVRSTSGDRATSSFANA
ncbi:MAG TPA: DHA2 family efflux MFS transporter permease subunit [Capillimicrobium sp.]|nr:DHA2 family efflux MFS transporter permease subunit [Capillimicrobium sp.]